MSTMSSHWINNKMSVAGRSVITQAILKAFPSHHFQAFLIPQGAYTNYYCWLLEHHIAEYFVISFDC
ncbi:hypothetical protein FRX31_025570 [Thalictrum thalictroides]|uniref:Uncharacterized protein n=1 Tax=Thalictrum thalictroides TaxID=46969 RepID=A0A7J6VIB4_THATH|nr:hypothetical protein FRX31_025570 [Thalictrum thalictroides]